MKEAQKEIYRSGTFFPALPKGVRGPASVPLDADPAHVEFMRRALRNVVAELNRLGLWDNEEKNTAGSRLGTLARVECDEGACKYSRAR
eukprot:3150277-Pyramimonas_sp.AAC.1